MTIKSFDSKIELSNQGQLSLFFLGTGSAFTKKFFQTNLVIVKENDYLLVDCGTLCPYVLNNIYNTDIGKIKNLLITHPHADHIGGVEEMALIGKYVENHKINMIVPGKLKKKLWKESLRGGLQFSEDGKMSFDDYFNHLNPKKILSKPFEMYDYQFGSLNIKLFRTRHVTTSAKSLHNSQLSYGIIIDDTILFTADTQFNPDQLHYLLDNYNIDTIFHDCDLFGYSEGVHASYKQLCTLDDDIKSKMYLCHYNDVDELPNPCNDGFAGFVKSGIYYNFGN